MSAHSCPKRFAYDCRLQLGFYPQEVIRFLLNDQKKAPKKNRPLQHNCPPGKLLWRSIVEWRTGLKLLAQATRISTPHPNEYFVWVRQTRNSRSRLRSQFLNGNYADAGCSCDIRKSVQYRFVLITFSSL